MAVCPKCGSEISDSAKFCPHCGSPIAPQEVVSAVNETVNEATAPVQETAQTVVPPQAAPVFAAEPAPPAEAPQPAAPVPAPEAPGQKKKFPVKALIFGLAGVALIALVILAISFFGGRGGSGANYAMYLKDKEIFFSDLKKNAKPRQLTSRLVNGDYNPSNEDLEDAGRNLAYYTVVSKDGKTVFYPDKVDDSVSVYYKSAVKADAEAKKIDSDVEIMRLNDAGTIVTYTKSDHTLYQYSLKSETKDKIASDVDRFVNTEDGSRVIFLTDDDALYLKDAGKDKEKLASDVTDIVSADKSMSAIYYLKDSALYRQVIGKDKEKIASDVYSMVNTYDSGEMYYLRTSGKPLVLMDYVDDDMKAADAAMVYPEYPEYPDWWDYDTDEAYDKALEEYDEACEEYWDYCDAWYEKEDRDELREALSQPTDEFAFYTLCYFDGKTETVISDGLFGYYGPDYEHADDSPAVVFSAVDKADMKKLKLSELDWYFSAWDFADRLEGTAEKFVAVKGTVAPLEENTAERMWVSPNGTSIFYVDEVDDDYVGSLYRITVKNGTVSKPEVYDTDVYAFYGRFLDDEQFAYVKDVKDYQGSLYISKTKIDDDVELYEGEYHSELKTLLYVIDFSDSSEAGTLKMYKDGKTTKIADDVRSFTVTPDGRVLYLHDYSLSAFKGDLSEWKDGQTGAIDDDVVFLFPVKTDDIVY